MTISSSIPHTPPSVPTVVPMNTSALRAALHGESIDRSNLQGKYRTLLDNCPVSAYLYQHLAPEDIMFINACGVDGEPQLADWLIQKLAMRLYIDPSLPRETTLSETPIPYSYCSREMVDEAAKATAGMRALAGMSYIPKPERDRMIEMADGTMRVIDAQLASARNQMTVMLQEARLILVQRGLDQTDARVIETMGIIDDVLARITNDKDTSATNSLLRLYSEPIKAKCECEIAKARNPFPLVDRFYKSVLQDNNGTLPRHVPDSRALDERYELAMDAVRSQARTMAEKLNELLAPFAGQEQDGNNSAADTGRSGPRSFQDFELV
jgi:hypothetical protein